MIKHNLMLALRNYKRFKATTLINLVGLSTGLACVLLIYLWVNDELSVDTFHQNNQRLYQIMERHNTSEGVMMGTHTSGLLAETIAEEIQGVEHIVAARSRDANKTISVGDVSFQGSVLFASRDFFKVFSFDLIQGNELQVFKDKSGIVISQELAMNLFNTTDNILGNTVEFDRSRQFQVSGVFANLPHNTSFEFDFILPFETYKDFDPNVLDWNYNTTAVYVVLDQDNDIQTFNSQIEHFLYSRRKDTNSTLTTRLYADAYLHGNYENGEQSGGRITYVLMFSIIGGFILIIACINFINLSTAKASRRLKEIGVKKAVGAGRNNLIAQYLGESILMVFSSMILGILLVLIMLPKFNLITAKQLSLHFDAWSISSVLAFIIITGLVAGSYPAIFLSGFKPVAILKGKVNTSLSEVLARKGLVIAQFTLSVVLIVSVLVVYKQINFVQSKNLGFDRENVVQFEIEGKVASKLETFLQEVKNLPGIATASSIGQDVVDGNNTFHIDSWEGKPDNVTYPAFQVRPITYDLFETLGIKLNKGREFSRSHADEGSKIIFNEKAIEIMGLTDPIGKVITIQGTELEIIGVTKDFHFASLHQEVGPLFFVFQPSWTHKIVAKIETGREREVIASLENLYQDFNSGFAFNYTFLDQNYQALYAAEKRVAVLSKYFTGLAMIISCLGLFGLASFTVEKRLKEIGIRKILGLSAFGVVQLLSIDFTKMVLLAIAIALPVSHLIANNWLDEFAYRIDLPWWLFALAGMLALIIAWFTVGLQTIKAARINPVDSLRNE